MSEWIGKYGYTFLPERNCVHCSCKKVACCTCHRVKVKSEKEFNELLALQEKEESN